MSEQEKEEIGTMGDHVVDDTPKAPESPKAEEFEFVPWDKVGFMTIGPKGIFLAPKGTPYPTPGKYPGTAAPAKAEDQKGAMEDVGKLTEQVKILEEKLKTAEAEIAEMKKPKLALTPEEQKKLDEEMKKKAQCDEPKAEAKAEAEVKEPVPPKSQQPKEEADHSSVSAFARELVRARGEGKI
jgi:regulator of replication initiation timing